MTYLKCNSYIQSVRMYFVVSNNYCVKTSIEYCALSLEEAEEKVKELSYDTSKSTSSYPLEDGELRLYDTDLKIPNFKTDLKLAIVRCKSRKPDDALCLLRCNI